jgi:hypothetical protein
LINVLTMSLDGLRAWIGEVERKLGARTRVFLVLLAIAIGASGAAIYLALDAGDNGGGSGGASVEDVQSQREQVELEGGESPQISTLEAQIVELRTEVEGLKAEEAETGGGSGKSGGSAAKGDESANKGIPETEAKPIPESGAEK